MTYIRSRKEGLSAAQLVMIEDRNNTGCMTESRREQHLNKSDFRRDGQNRL